MAELSLRQQIARNEYERNYKPQLDLLSGFAGEVKWNSPYAASARINCLNYADSIISLILVKVDSAGLTDEQLHKIHDCDDVCESDCSGCSLIKQVAGFQLQAVKDILEGK